MLSEAGHSLVDTVNQLLLLYGMKRAATGPDESHPYRYGRERFIDPQKYIGNGCHSRIICGSTAKTENQIKPRYVW